MFSETPCIPESSVYLNNLMFTETPCIPESSVYLNHLMFSETPCIPKSSVYLNHTMRHRICTERPQSSVYLWSLSCKSYFDVGASINNSKSKDDKISKLCIM